MRNQYRTLAFATDYQDIIYFGGLFEFWPTCYSSTNFNFFLKKSPQETEGGLAKLINGVKSSLGVPGKET